MHYGALYNAFASANIKVNRNYQAAKKCAFEKQSKGIPFYYYSIFFCATAKEMTKAYMKSK